VEIYEGNEVTNMTRDAVLYHPTFGHFKAVGQTQHEANEKCLKKVSITLEKAEITEENAIVFLIQADKTLKKHTR